MRSLEKPNWKKRQERKKVIWLGVFGVILIAGLISGLAFYVWNHPPTGFGVEASGTTITVKAGGDLQAAIDRAKAGDTILLQPGAVYKGSFKLPNKAGNEFVTIRTSAPDAQLPPADTRLDPKKYAAVLPKIISIVKSEPSITATNGAHHYRFIGIEFGPTVEGLYNIIQLGTTEEKTIDELPHHIEFDRVYIHGSPTEGQRRGIAANGRYLKIQNSYFSDFKREGEESQAIGVWGTDGHIEIINNYLEAAAENILFGGAPSNLKLVAADCVVRDNWMNKPLEWRNSKWVVKNFFEIKSGKRIKIENNLMTNNWAQAQEGTGVLFRTGTDSGDQAVVEDVEFTNNIVRGTGSAITIFGGEGAGGRRLTIRNNVFEDVTSKKWDGRGFFIKPTTWDNLIIENNTVIHDGSITIAYGAPINNFVFRNNIVFQNEYGFFGDGVGSGKVALDKYFPKAVIIDNVIVGGSAADDGAANFYPNSISQIGFTDIAKSDYRLKRDSPYLTKGFEGKNIGANLDPKTVGGK